MVYSCYLIVYCANLLLGINDLKDFSFIYDELLDKYPSEQGRVAECVIKLFKYSLLKVIYILSDVDIVESLSYDMSFKYFLEMLLEQDLIIPSTLKRS